MDDGSIVVAVAVRPLNPGQSSCLTRNLSVVSAFEVNSSKRGDFLIERTRWNGQMVCVSLLELRGLVPTSYAGVEVGRVLLRNVCVYGEPRQSNEEAELS